MFLFESTGKNNDVEFELPIVSENYSPDMAGALLITNESAQDWCSLIESTMFGDLQEYAARLKKNLTEAQTISEGVLTNFWDKAQKIFENLWAKLKSLLTNFKNMILSLIAGGEKFVTKYGKLIKDKAEKGDFKRFAYEGFEWDIPGKLSLDKVYSTFEKESELAKIKDATEADVTAFSKKFAESDATDKLRGDVTGGGSLSDAAYKQKLFEMFRKGRSTAKPDMGVSAASIEEMLKVIGDKGSALKDITEATSNIDKHFSGLITDIKALKSELSKKDNAFAHKMAIMSLEHIKKGEAVANSALGAELTAIKMRLSEYKNVLNKLVTYKAASEGTVSESFMLCSEMTTYEVDEASEIQA